MKEKDILVAEAVDEVARNELKRLNSVTNSIVDAVNGNAEYLIGVGRGLAFTCVVVGGMFAISRIRRKRLEKRVDILEKKLSEKESEKTGE